MSDIYAMLATVKDEPVHTLCDSQFLLNFVISRYLMTIVGHCFEIHFKIKNYSHLYSFDLLNVLLFYFAYYDSMLASF